MMYEETWGHNFNVCRIQLLNRNKTMNILMVMNKNGDNPQINDI
jgi:hypothetical protein